LGLDWNSFLKKAITFKTSISRKEFIN
jgi:hypothetical protein